MVHKSEPLLADFAFKRPIAGVDTHKTIEVEQPTPCLFADVALKVLLSVYPLQCVRTASTAAGRRVAVRLGYRDRSS